MSHPHILFLETLTAISGGQRVLLDLLPAISRAYRVTVAVPGPGPLAMAVEQLGLPTVCLPVPAYSLVKKGWGDVATFAASTPRLALELRRTIRRLKIDLVYANAGGSFVWGALGAMLAGRPIIWHSHNILGDGKSLWLTRRLAKFSAVRQIIGTSAEAGGQFQQPHKTVTVTAGVDLALFAPAPEQRLAMRAQLNLAGQTVAIGILGDFIPLKGQNIFLQAVRQLQSENFPVQAVVVGKIRPNPESRQFRDSLAELLQQTGAYVLSWEVNLPALLNALDLVVVASRTETGPLVLYQALACGVPVISPPVGNAPQLLAGPDSPGALYPANNVAALVQEIKTFLASDARWAQAKQQARALAESHLDLQEAQQNIIQLIATNLEK